MEGPSILDGLAWMPVDQHYGAWGVYTLWVRTAVRAVGVGGPDGTPETGAWTGARAAGGTCIFSCFTCNM